MLNVMPVLRPVVLNTPLKSPVLILKASNHVVNIKSLSEVYQKLLPMLKVCAIFQIGIFLILASIHNENQQLKVGLLE